MAPKLGFSKSLDLAPDSAKYPNPDPESVNTDPKHWPRLVPVIQYYCIDGSILY